MTKRTMAQRAIDYVYAHPGSSAVEVAMGIGNPSHASVSVALNRAEQFARLRSNMAPGEGHKGNPRLFYPPGETTETDVVISRARRIGGPFAIVLAQLLRSPSY